MLPAAGSTTERAPNGRLKSHLPSLSLSRLAGSASGNAFYWVEPVAFALTVSTPSKNPAPSPQPLHTRTAVPLEISVAMVFPKKTRPLPPPP